MKIWVLVEEPEWRSFADGSTYLVLSAHMSEKQVDEARDEWRAEHGEPPHKFSSPGFSPTGDGDDDWCNTCGSGVSVSEVDLT